jgi:hypothetical protein
MKVKAEDAGRSSQHMGLSPQDICPGTGVCDDRSNG